MTQFGLDLRHSMRVSEILSTILGFHCLLTTNFLQNVFELIMAIIV